MKEYCIDCGVELEEWELIRCMLCDEINKDKE
jgi:hypothetical protein